MKTQLEFIREILALKEAHPAMPIQFFVSAEIVDYYKYTAHVITLVEINAYNPSHKPTISVFTGNGTDEGAEDAKGEK